MRNTRYSIKRYPLTPILSLMLLASAHLFSPVAKLSNSQAFAIYLTHTSFQLYHCSFPAAYLREIHDCGTVSGEGVVLESSPAYDFVLPEGRAAWIDVFVALIDFLRSGRSKVGFLNNTIVKNMIHKVWDPNHFVHSCFRLIGWLKLKSAGDDARGGVSNSQWSDAS